jgi:hypothetical protein
MYACEFQKPSIETVDPLAAPADVAGATEAMSADVGTKLTRLRPDRASPATATVRLNRRK